MLQISYLLLELFTIALNKVQDLANTMQPVGAKRPVALVVSVPQPMLLLSIFNYFK